LVKGQGSPEPISDYEAQRPIRPRCIGTIRTETQCKSIVCPIPPSHPAALPTHPSIHVSVYLSGSKGKGVSAKLELRWSKPMIIAKFLKPNVVQLANADTGVVVKKSHVCQVKTYHKDGQFQVQNK
jgi:hypothetical protein